MPVLSSHLFDMILIGIFAEFLILAFLCRRHNRHRLILPLALFLGSGAALMGALRFAIDGQQDLWVSISLSVALVAHIAFLALFFRDAQGRREKEFAGSH
ncbi:MAG: hypothetical protein AAGA69_04000 [Pseudomonadota bacterium]